MLFIYAYNKICQFNKMLIFIFFLLQMRFSAYSALKNLGCSANFCCHQKLVSCDKPKRNLPKPVKQQLDAVSTTSLNSRGRSVKTKLGVNLGIAQILKPFIHKFLSL